MIDKISKLESERNELIIKNRKLARQKQQRRKETADEDWEIRLVKKV